MPSPTQAMPNRIPLRSRRKALPKSFSADRSAKVMILGAQCTLFPGDQHRGGIKAGAVADGNETAAKCGLQPMALSVGEQCGGPRY